LGDGNLNFHSSTYEWLMVSGARAQFRGAGTINGAGNYGFIMTAIDSQINGGGGTDKFRIKIWDTGGIVYDNQIGAADTADLRPMKMDHQAPVSNWIAAAFEAASFFFSFFHESLIEIL
jgi:hypothetical protein